MHRLRNLEQAIGGMDTGSFRTPGEQATSDGDGDEDLPKMEL